MHYQALAFDGKHKIQDRFEEELYYVIEQPRVNIPVYKVRSRQSQKTKVLHRNHLVPVYHQDEEDDSRTDVQPLVEEDTSTKEDEVKMKTDRSGNRRDEEESDSDDGNSCVYYVNRGGDAHLPRDLSTEEFSQRRTTEFMRLVEDEDIEDEEDVEDTRPGRDAADIIDVAEEETVEEEVVEVSTEEPTGTTEEETGTQPSQEEQDHEDTGDVRSTEEENSQPAVRRSVRDRRPPKKYDGYVMKQVTRRPTDIRTDYRIQALTELVNSGVLQNIDSLIAQRLVDSVMK